MKKRFIAGAVCPKCAQSDCLQAYVDEDRHMNVRECVDCGFTDEISTIVNQPSELPTRVNEVDQKTDVAPEPIRFDPNKLH